MTVRTIRPVLRSLVALCAIVLACRSERPDAFQPLAVQDAFARAMRRGPGAIATVDTLGPRNWTSFYVFGPYTSDDFMRKCLATSQFESYGMDKRDDAYAVYFRAPGGFVSSLTLSRADVRFSADALGRGFPKGAASFVVRRDSLGRAELAPRGPIPGSCS